MEDVNPSQSTDVEQPHHSVNHNRPFFYVQPPSQPYFMYQWPMDPFGQYSFPGPAFPFGRPYVSPYQYMQYPGYVVPHAPMQPTDYRRMTPFIPSVASYDLRFRQHFQQMSVQRETTSSEAQTEAGDPVGKLLHSLGGLQASEEPSPVKDPDAMLASTPVITSHAHEVEKLNHAEGRLESEPVVQPAKVEPEDMARADNFDSAVYDADSSPCCLEGLSDVLPLDSSSLHEENQSRGKDDAQHDVEKPCLQRQKLPSDDVCGVPGNGGRSASCSAEVGDSESRVSAVNEKSDSCNAKPPELAERIQDLPLDSAEPLMQGSADYDLSYQILRLPCNKTTTGLVLQKDINPLVYLDSASTLLPPRRYSFGSAYPYSYYPQVAQERQSILSPSLDELSSRDDMFSTDVEDEMMSGHVYVGGSKLAETSGVPTRSAKEHRDDACSACAKTCACCGASLVDEDESVALPERYGEGEVAQELSNHECDCDLEEEALGTCESRNVSSRLYLSRPVLPPTGRQITKHKVRKVQDGADLSDQEQGPVEELHAAAKVDRVKVKGQKGSHPRSYSEHQWRDCQPEHLMDKESWTSSGGKQRSRSCRPTNGLQEKGGISLDIPDSCEGFALPFSGWATVGDLHAEGLPARCLFSKGPGEMSMMTMTRQILPMVKGEEGDVTGLCLDLLAHALSCAWIREVWTQANITGGWAALLGFKVPSTETVLRTLRRLGIGNAAESQRAKKEGKWTLGQSG